MSKQFFKTISYTDALKLGPRKFVKTYLFPAMRREHGNGFAMQTWNCDTRFTNPDCLDDIPDRQAPACQSVMCIGGTLRAITGAKSEKSLSRLLGLPFRDDNGNDQGWQDLFYRWTSDRGPWTGLSKPFVQAKTPAAKERIAEKAVMAAIRIGERLRKAKKQ